MAHFLKKMTPNRKRCKRYRREKEKQKNIYLSFSIDRSNASQRISSALMALDRVQCDQDG